MDNIRLVRLVGLLMLVLTTGCANVRPVFQQTDTVTVFEIDRDTILYVQPDTAMFQAWFECDSLNRVVMYDLAIMTGRKITPVVKWRDNFLTVIAEVDSEAVYLAWKERNVTRTVTLTPEPVVVTIKEPPWWMKTSLVVTIIIIALFAGLIIKLYMDTR